MFSELWVFFCHKLPPVNQTLHVTILDLETAGRGAVSDSYNSQLATRPVQNRAAVWFAAGGGIFENLLKTYACVNSRQFHEVELNFLL